MHNQISNIVFTKNRPLQLQAYLDSLYRHFPSELIKTYMLYKPELFRKEYEQLFSNYPGCVVIEEKDFSSDFFGILNRINTKYILFGVDDVVYFDSVDFEVIDEVFETCPNDILGFSLRSGQNVIETGKDRIDTITVGNQTVNRVNWNTGQTPNTRYPFELCATVYRTATVREIISSARNNNPLVKKLFSPSSALIKVLGKIISVRSILKSFGYFYSPNTLESWNCRWCRNCGQQLPGYIYFQKLCATAIQVNMVNTSTNNESDNMPEHTVEALNAEYRQGRRLDIDAIEKNKPGKTHVGMEHFVLTN